MEHRPFDLPDVLQLGVLFYIAASASYIFVYPVIGACVYEFGYLYLKSSRGVRSNDTSEMYEMQEERRSS